MIFIRHTESCAGKPNVAGHLTGTCDCKTAGLDEDARAKLHAFLGDLAEASLATEEEAEYFVLRLEGLAQEAAKEARNARRSLTDFRPARRDRRLRMKERS